MTSSFHLYSCSSKSLSFKLLSRKKMQPSHPQAFRQLRAAGKRREPKNWEGISRVVLLLYFLACCLSRCASTVWTPERGQMQYGFWPCHSTRPDIASPCRGMKSILRNIPQTKKNSLPVKIKSSPTFAFSKVILVNTLNLLIEYLSVVVILETPPKA